MKWVFPVLALVILALWTLSFFRSFLYGFETPAGFFFAVNHAGSLSLGFNPEFRSGFVFHHDTFAKGTEFSSEFPELTLKSTLAGRFGWKLERVSGPSWFFLATVPYWLLYAAYLIFLGILQRNRILLFRGRGKSAEPASDHQPPTGPESP